MPSVLDGGALNEAQTTGEIDINASDDIGWQGPVVPSADAILDSHPGGGATRVAIAASMSDGDVVFGDNRF